MKTQAQFILEKLNIDFNISDEKIADKLKVSAMTIRRWRIGETKCSYAELKLLQRILRGYENVSK